MSEEQILLNHMYLRYIPLVPDLREKRNESGWKEGYLVITTQRLLLVPSKNGKPVDAEALVVNLTEVTEVDRKVELWKKIVTTGKIMPIHYVQKGNEFVSLLSTSMDNAVMIKKMLILLMVSGANVEFVCPFSKGGKILLEKQPVKGQMVIQDDAIVLVSEWLGKKQQEVISITKLDDFECSQSENQASLILRYLKDGSLISTLITSEKRVILSTEKYLKMIRGVEEEETFDLDEKQFMLLQMMYTSDIDSQMAMEMLGVSVADLDGLVRTLVRINLLKFSGTDEVELTEKGTKYIVEQLKKNIVKV